VTELLKTKRFKVRVSVEEITRAYVESLYFNEIVKKVGIVIKKNSNQEVEIRCYGRGTLRGKIRKDAAEIWVSGTSEEVLGWEQFFRDFVSVPEFSLREYMNWAKGYIKPPKE